MDYQLAVSISAGIIAVCALGVSVWHGYLMRKHNKLSVSPHLVIDNRSIGETPVSYKLKNNGLGPAVVKSFEIYLDNKLLVNHENDMNEVVNSLELEGCILSTYHPSIGQSISVSDEHYLLKLNYESMSETQVTTARSLKDRLFFKIKYSSIYGDLFLLNGNC